MAKKHSQKSLDTSHSPHLEWASEKDKLEIYSLIAQREKLTRKIVALPAALLSMTTPSILWRYFFSPGAPLSSVTELAATALASSAQAHVLKVLNTIRKNQHEADAEYNSFIESFRLFIHIYGPEFSMKEFCKYLDQLSTPEGIALAANNIHTNWGKALISYAQENGLLRYKILFFNTLSKLISVAPIKSLMPYIKVSSVETINVARGSVKNPNLKTIGTTISALSPELTTESFTNLYNYIEESHTHLIEGMRDNLDYDKELLSDFDNFALSTSQLVAYKGFLLLTVGAGVLAKNFLADRAIAAVYKRYLLQPLPDIKNKLLSIEEAKKIKDQLIKENDLLEFKAEKNLRFIRYVSSVIAPALFLFILTSERFNPEPVILLISLLITAFSDAGKYVEETYSNYRFRQEMTSKQNFINSLTRDVSNQQWALYCDAHIEGSYFTLNVDSQIQHLSNKQLANLLKQAFIKFGIQATLKSNQVTVPAKFHLSKSQTTALKTFLMQSIERKIALKNIAKAFNKLVNFLNVNYVKMPYFDAQGLQEENISIHLHGITISTINQIKNIFSEFTLSESQGFLNISGHVFTKEKELNAFLYSKVEKTLSESRKTEHEEISHSSSEENSLSEVKSNKKRQNKEKEEFEQKTVAVKPKLIKWKSAIYNSTNPNCKVFPVKAAHLPEGRIFTYFALTEKHFPNAFLYRKFKEMSESGTLSAKPKHEKTAPGIAFFNQWVNGIDGPMPAVAKIRLLSDTDGSGDVRVYGTKELAENGETLIVFKGIGSHK